jgi:hypothetical protein
MNVQFRVQKDIVPTVYILNDCEDEKGTNKKNNEGENYFSPYFISLTDKPDVSYNT